MATATGSSAEDRAASAQVRRADWQSAGGGAALACAIGIGAVAGGSPLLDGFYPRELWAILGMVVLALLMVALVVGRRAPGRLALAAPATLVALALWQYLSRGWAESANQALIEAQRTGVYAACLGLAVVVTGSAQARRALLIALAAAVAGLAVLEWFRLASGPAPADFVSGRLNDPLGYTNGQAAALLMGFWPCIAIAERGAHRWAGAAAVSAASLVLSLTFLTQSRAALGALAVTAVALLVLFPGRGRRLVALTFPALALAAGAPQMLDVYTAGSEGAALPPAEVLHPAMATAMVASLMAGALWACVDYAVQIMPPLPGLKRAVPSLVAVAAVVALTVVAVGAIPFARAVDRQWESFRSLEQVTGANRLTTAGGNRYDYWRVAVDQLRDDPIKGSGAGNYDRDYFRERRTGEDIRQPHSIQLQALAETGLVGFALLLTLLGVAVAAVVRAARRAQAGPSDDRSLIVACAGVFALWLVQTSVDWMHLLPGLTLGSLAALAVLLRLGDQPRPQAERSPVPMRAVAFALATLAFASLVSGYVADRNREAAQELVATDPRAALNKAGDSLRLEDDSLPTHYVLAAAYARLGNYEKAVATLQRARALEPSDFVPPTLLGDLALRRGDRTLAVREYQTAVSLNPGNVTLQESLALAQGANRSDPGP